MDAKQPKQTVSPERLISAADAILSDAKIVRDGTIMPASANFTKDETFEAYLFLCRLGMEKDAMRKAAK